MTTRSRDEVLSPSDPPVLRHEASGRPFTYTDVGTGPVIVAVHGLPGSGRDYRYLGAALESRARFVRLDMPGFGGTPRTSAEGTDVVSRARFVHHALGALAIERCVLVGHSMGGPVALVAASRPPAGTTIAGLGLLASVGTRPHRLLRRMPMRRALGRAIDLPLLGPIALRIASAGFRSRGFPSSTPPSDVTQTMRIIAAFDFAPVVDALAALRAPTLVAFAEDDPFIEPEIPRELGARAPAGPRLHWPLGGHNVQKTHARAIADALLTLA